MKLKEKQEVILIFLNESFKIRKTSGKTKKQECLGKTMIEK